MSKGELQKYTLTDKERAWLFDLFDRLQLQGTRAQVIEQIAIMDSITQKLIAIPAFLSEMETQPDAAINGKVKETETA